MKNMKLFKITQGEMVRYVAAKTMEIAIKVKNCGCIAPDFCEEIADTEPRFNPDKRINLFTIVS